MCEEEEERIFVFFSDRAREARKKTPDISSEKRSRRKANFLQDKCSLVAFLTLLTSDRASFVVVNRI